MGTEVVTVATGDGPPHDVRPFLVYPIGKVCKRGPTTAIEVESRHRDGLMGLGDFSHVWVFYWLDQNDIPEKRGVLRVHPRGDECNPLTGVFATRAPVRPNPIGLALCKLHSINGTTIEIDDIDAFDGTPVLDLKPYLPGSAPTSGVRSPQWVSGGTP